MGKILFIACVIVCIAIIVYFYLDYFSGKRYRSNIEILEILKKVNEKKKESKAVTKEEVPNKDLQSEEIDLVCEN